MPCRQFVDLRHFTPNIRNPKDSAQNMWIVDGKSPLWHQMTQIEIYTLILRNVFNSYALKKQNLLNFVYESNRRFSPAISISHLSKRE